MPRNKKLLEEIKLALSTMPEDIELEQPQTAEVQPDKVTETKQEIQPVVKAKEPRIGIHCHSKECKKQTPDVDFKIVECPGKVDGKVRYQAKAQCQVCGKNKSGFKPKDL